MVLYNCVICNFTSVKITNYNRHLITKKHITNVKKRDNKESFVTPENSQNTSMLQSHNSNHMSTQNNEMEITATKCNTTKKCFVCKFCDKTFGKHQSYYRHMKYYCKDKPQNINILNSIFTKLIESKDELISCQKENLRLLKKQNKNMKDIQNCNINNTYNQTINTMNNTNYVFNFMKYSDADTMETLKDKFRLTREEFIKASSSTGYRGALLEKADNVIIKPYLDKKFIRPIQTVDSSRNKALFKDSFNNKWTFTPKTTLEHCFKEFHLSALEHQDQTIRDNPNLIIESIEDTLYKQTYFIPTDSKEKNSIYRDINNHIYKETKVSKQNNTINDVIKYLENNYDNSL